MDTSHGAGRTTPVPGSTGQREPLVAPAAILEGLPDAVVAIARTGRIVFVNALAEALFGYPRDELLGQPAQMLWPQRVRDRYVRNMEHYFDTEHPLRFSTEVWGLRRDGSEFPGEMSWGTVRTSAGPLLLAIGRDISARRTSEMRSRAVAAMAERALSGVDPGELATDAVGLLRTALPVAGARVTLEDGTVLASTGWTDPAQPTALRLPIGASDELLVAPHDGLTDDEMSVVLAISSTLSTALARLRGEERMRHDAVHDPLTGLANRTLLRDRLEHALARSAREGGETCVLFVDLDNFKQVNDAHGHAAGDAVLVELSGRLRTAVRPADTVARLGGDEFVVVCEQVDEAGAVAFAHRLEEAIRLPLTVGGVVHDLSASIGIALGHDDPDALLHEADTAVYRAKAGQGGRVEVFRAG